MKHQLTRILLVVTAVALVTACSDDSINPINTRTGQGEASLQKVSDEYLVEYTGQLVRLEKEIQNMGGTILRVYEPIRIACVTGLTDAQAAALEAGSVATSVALDRQVRWIPSTIAAVAGPAVLTPYVNPTGNPADALYYPIQWGMRQIHADQAWTVTKGEGVRVGILDTGGSPDHVDLDGKYDIPACRNFSHSNANDPFDWQDREGHGTLMAGIVATNNIFLAGVAPDATLVAVKVLGDDGYADWGEIIAGIMYAADPNGGDCDIINMSIGAYMPVKDWAKEYAMIAKAVNWARSKGCLVVSAAGNDAADLDHDVSMMSTPAQSGTSMAVSATGPTYQADFDGFACYSNYGVSVISVAAPGGNFNCATGGLYDLFDLVASTFAPYVHMQLGWPGDPYSSVALVAGTSPAAPHVSGTAALIIAAKGNSNPGYLSSRIENTADDLGPVGADPWYGKGRVNAAAAVQ